MKKRLVDFMYVLFSCALIYGINRYTNRDIIQTEIIKYDVEDIYQKVSTTPLMDVSKMDKPDDWSLNLY